MRLTSPGIEPVDLPITSGDPAEGTVSPSSLRFTADNWDKPQTVTVTGADDDRKDGNRGYTVAVGPAVSQDRRYAGLEGTRVTLLNRDDEPGFSIEAAATLVTSESGAQATFRVVLNRAPLATVRLALSSSNEAEGKVSPAELVFEPSDWNQPQTATVVGIEDDGERDGSQVFRILTGPAVSADPDYDGIDPGDLQARNRDNDFVRVAAQVVSGNLFCPASGGARQRLAQDGEGNLYAAMTCARSLGSSPPPTGGTGHGWHRRVGRHGRSAGPPTAPAGRDLGRVRGHQHRRRPHLQTPRRHGRARLRRAGRRRLAGVVLVAGNGLSGLAVGRSDDGGATWKGPSMLSGFGDNLRLAAAGDTAAIYADTQNGPTLSISLDSGQTWTARPAPSMGQTSGLGVDAPTGAVWITSFDGTLSMRLSRDGGATFDGSVTLAGQMDGYYDTYAVSPRTAFLAGKVPHVMIVARDLSSRRQVEGLFPDVAFPRVLVCDDQENLVVLESQTGTLQARRLPAGATAFQPPRTVGTAQGPPSAVAIASHAIAIAITSGNQVQVAVEVWTP